MAVGGGPLTHSRGARLERGTTADEGVGGAIASGWEVGIIEGRRGRGGGEKITSFPTHMLAAIASGSDAGGRPFVGGLGGSKPQQGGRRRSGAGKT